MAFLAQPVRFFFELSNIQYLITDELQFVVRFLQSATFLVFPVSPQLCNTTFTMALLARPVDDYFQLRSKHKACCLPLTFLSCICIPLHVSCNWTSSKSFLFWRSVLANLSLMLCAVNLCLLATWLNEFLFSLTNSESIWEKVIELQKIIVDRSCVNYFQLLSWAALNYLALVSNLICCS